MKQIDNKVLHDLKKKGWKSGNIKYTHFKVYVKGDFGILYNTQTDSIIVKYHRGNDK